MTIDPKRRHINEYRAHSSKWQWIHVSASTNNKDRRRRTQSNSMNKLSTQQHQWTSIPNTYNSKHNAIPNHRIQRHHNRAHTQISELVQLATQYTQLYESQAKHKPNRSHTIGKTEPRPKLANNAWGLASNQHKYTSTRGDPKSRQIHRAEISINPWEFIAKHWVMWGFDPH